MAEFRMPSLGADMEHGKVVEWLVKPGDYVHKGDIVAAVDTDKTVMDIESFEEGVVAEFLVDIGDTVNVGTPIARFTPTPADRSPAPSEPTPTVASAGEPRPAPAVVEPKVPSPPAVKHGSKISPPVRHLAHSLGVDVGSIRGSGLNGEVTRADVESAAAESTARGVPAAPGAQNGPAYQRRMRSSPRARRLATQVGVDLQEVVGTGPDGAITESDVRRAAGAATGKRVEAMASEPPRQAEPAVDAAPRSRKEIGGDKAATLRQAIGSLMSRSKKEIPHYYLANTLDLATAMAWMQSQNQQRPVSSRLVPSALLLKATALAAKETPEMNGFFTRGTFHPSASVHLGVAVALRHGGLVAPALHDAQTLTLDELMDKLRGLVSRARAGRLQRAEMTDPTITVTNLGDLGVDSVYGVIYPPQVAMVGFGKVLEQPWAHNGMLGIRHTVAATLSADHRVSDGLRGGRFLSRIDELLQRPEEL
ncbi:2-oxo acid dehydrogenase subunit E2 [Arthrobacter sp. Bz4]|uniref:2-oxo acid dehydrogenase subunit E2 n=1 Tax=Arthrobacter sp. Bz4 TaxID=2171979 RepID=UPI000D52188E|nr:2-oxo acid dehydrogenase subunit E2 [Arthrobacter sp. Bz4]PVE16233.1 dehydrogenase [Arthrobacter sp. Bz4]